jgi:response regulator RpfG family c-di-GMP phosphodiesterase
MEALLVPLGYDVVAIQDCVKALQSAKDYLPDLILLDVMMPIMDGFAVATVIRRDEKTRAIPIVMVTALSDVESRVKALEAGADDFLTKPVDKAELQARVKSLVTLKRYNDKIYEQQNQITELLDKTLKGSIRMLVDILSSVNPQGFGRAAKLMPLARKVIKHLAIKSASEVELALMLAPIGCIAIPGEISQKAFACMPLTLEEQDLFMSHASKGKVLLERIPHLAGIADAIGYQFKQYDGGGFPHDNIKGEQIPVTARLLKVLFDFNNLLGKGFMEGDAVNKLDQQKSWYDPNILSALRKTVITEKQEYEILSIRSLLPGMVVAEDIVESDGTLLVPKGTEITTTIQLRLLNYVNMHLVGAVVQVYPKCDGE